MGRKMLYLVWAIVGIVTTSCTHALVVDNNPGEVFRIFWEKMDQSYVNFAEHPLDWDSIWAEYYPKACQAQSEEELIKLFVPIIVQDLHDGHVAIFNNCADEVICSAIGQIRADSDPYTDTEYSCLTYCYSPIHVQYPVYSGIITPVTGTLEISPATYDTCAYINIAGFEKQTDAYLHDAIRSALRYNPKGWIIDLRGNGGGELSSMINFCSYFYTGERRLFQNYVRVSPDDRYAMKEVGHSTMPGQGLISEDIPVIVIIDYSVYSAANVCTYILSEFPNVMVIGISATYGGGAPPTFTTLPNGWKLWAPTDYKIFVNNKSTEYPFQPDSVVCASYSDFLTNLIGKDTTVDLSTYIALSLIDKEIHE